MPALPPAPAGAVVSFSVALGGSDLPDTIQVLALRVRTASGRPAAASLVLASDADLASSPLFAPGRSIRLAAGYDGQNRELFAGTLAGLRLASSRTGGLFLTLECTGPAPAPVPPDRPPALALAFGVDLLEFQLVAGTPPSGHLQLAGTAAVAPGERVTLSGLGPRFDGPLPVASVTHEIEAGRWTATLGIGPAPTTPDRLTVASDETRRTFSLATPGGQIFSLSDDDRSILLADSNGNRLRLSPAGLELVSAAGLHLQAAQQIAVSSGSAGIKLAAPGGDLVLQGLNVSARADVSAVVSGSAQAELSASGQTTVKGGLVLIN